MTRIDGANSPATAAAIGDEAADDDVALARRLADEAGRLLIELREDLWQRRTAGWQIMDAGDAAAHELLIDRLRSARPNDTVLSEEAADDRRRLQADRVWIIDPLDGTTEYGEYGSQEWAVHIALWQRGLGITAAAVALPAFGVTLVTDPPAALTVPQHTTTRMITSRNRAPFAAAAVARALNLDVVRMGSAGAKTMAVVLGHADLYLHDGGMYQWDSAAPSAVAAAAGLFVSRVDGSPIVYNAPDTWLPDFIVCRHELVGPVFTVLWGPDHPLASHPSDGVATI
jgi:3'(2'), 5'-bisphosphate nucleotidase